MTADVVIASAHTRHWGTSPHRSFSSATGEIGKERCGATNHVNEHSHAISESSTTVTQTEGHTSET